MAPTLTLLVIALGATGVGAEVARAEDEPPPRVLVREEPSLPGFGAPRFELADISAWTLRDGELEIGPTAVRYGLFDLVHIGTRFALNLFGALNADAKWTIHDDDAIAVAVEAGLLRFDPELVGIDDDFSVWAFPVSLRASGRPNENMRVHLAVEFLSARPEGETSDTVKRIQRYLGPTGRLAAQLGFEWRVHELVALIAELEAPFILHHATLRYDDEDDALDFLTGRLSLQLVYESLNVRLGGGYGPSFLGQSGWFPVFELALRIY